MKKLFAIILSGLIICSFAACGQNNASSQSSTEAATTAAEAETSASEGGDVITGGITDAASPVVPDEVKTVFDKAAATLTGVGYEPVAYLGSQVVAGTNHFLLCKATPTTADPKATYVIVTLFEGLNGEAEITDVANSDIEAPAPTDSENPIAGGYTEPETPEVTPEAQKALTKALEGLDGAQYEAKALLGTQIVSGTNYMLLCKITPVTANPQPHYSIVTVYEDLEGNASISDTHDFNAADDAAAFQRCRRRCGNRRSAVRNLQRLT